MQQEQQSNPVRTFKDLIVWQRAIDLAELVYRITDAFPKAEVYGLTSQMRRAAISVASNVAEGQSRNSRGEFLQFLGHARGSLAELETQVIIAVRLQLISTESASTVTEQLALVGRPLNALRTSLREEK